MLLLMSLRLFVDVLIAVLVEVFVDVLVDVFVAAIWDRHFGKHQKKSFKSQIHK